MEATYEVESQQHGCGGCFRNFMLFTTQKHATNNTDQVHLLPERWPERESWVVRQVKKLREVSELVAGPKWKNLLRKIGAYFGNNNKKKGFQYDSFNYTLNFDDGIQIMIMMVLILAFRRGSLPLFSMMTKPDRLLHDGLFLCIVI
ncbi:Protein BCH2 [Bienertia sinuspersici]